MSVVENERGWLEPRPIVAEDHLPSPYKYSRVWLVLVIVTVMCVDRPFVGLQRLRCSGHCDAFTQFPPSDSLAKWGPGPVACPYAYFQRLRVYQRLILTSNA